MLRQLLPALALCAGVACGGDVSVGDGTGGRGHGAGGDTPAGDGGPNPSCAVCGVQSCGLCDQITVSGVIFACRGSGPPLTDMACYQTGSIFHDDEGPYVCWSCE